MISDVTISLAELEMHTRMKLVPDEWEDVRVELQGDAGSDSAAQALR